jgi:hypothetical protein
MPKAEPKTQRTKASVAAFIASVEDETRRKDAKTLDKVFREITGERPAMWGPTIIGYGQYRYASASGREGVWPRAGFSPRKANMVVYIMPGFKGYGPLLKKLGKHKTGKSCLYMNRLADVDQGALRDLIARSWSYMEEKYG